MVLEKIQLGSKPRSMETVQPWVVILMCALVAQYTLWGKECISQESSPGHIDGNDVFYH